MRKDPLKHSKKELRDFVDNFSMSVHYKNGQQSDEIVFSSVVNGEQKNCSFNKNDCPHLGMIIKNFFKKEDSRKSVYPDDFYFIIKRFVRNACGDDICNLYPPNLLFNDSFINYCMDHNEDTFGWLVRNGLISIAFLQRLRSALSKNAKIVLQNSTPYQQFLIINMENYWNYFNTQRQPDVLNYTVHKQLLISKFCEDQLSNILCVNPHMIQYLKNQTKPLILESILRNGALIKYVDRKFWDNELCLIALTNNGSAICHLIEGNFEKAKTSLWIAIAMTKTPYVITKLSQDLVTDDLFKMGCQYNELSRTLMEKHHLTTDERKKWLNETFKN